MTSSFLFPCFPFLSLLTATSTMSAIHRLLVVGGNGYLGSAVCRAAVGRGWQVTSIRYVPFFFPPSFLSSCFFALSLSFITISYTYPSSSSGKPALTPGGHARAWTRQVQWTKASAFDPPSYASLLSSSTAVVHTLGILLESDYKGAVRGGDLFGLARSLLGGKGNPLKDTQGGSERRKNGYEAMNRDSGEL